MATYTLPKSERLHSRTVIERLFAGGNRSFPAFPLRVVYLWLEPEAGCGASAEVLVSVPKKRFKRAVKRNRVKRQVKEAYRKNRYLLADALASRGKRLVIAFIWLGNELYASAEIEQRVRRLLFHIAEDQA